MKPKEKERLARNRANIVRTLDVSTVLDPLRKQNAIDKKDEQWILDDPRRRQQAARLLDTLEGKKTSSYEAFLDVLGDHYPQLYVQMVGWDDEDEDGGEGPYAMTRDAEDEWTQVRRMRRLLIDDLDAARVMPFLREKDVLTQSEVAQIMHIKASPKRTEAFLDVLETKSSEAYQQFLESLSESYPHLYLLLIERDEEEEFDSLYG